MRFTGKLKEPIIDYLTGRLTILFEPCEDFRQAYEELKDYGKLSLEKVLVIDIRAATTRLLR